MLACKSAPRETGVFIIQIENQDRLTACSQHPQLVEGVGRGLHPRLPLSPPFSALLLMLRNGRGSGVCPCTKVEVGGQLAGIGLLTPFFGWVQGNELGSSLAERTSTLSRITGPHWCLFGLFCDSLSFHQGCPCDHGFGTILWNLVSSAGHMGVLSQFPDSGFRIPGFTASGRMGPRLN